MFSRTTLICPVVYKCRRGGGEGGPPVVSVVAVENQSGERAAAAEGVGVLNRFSIIVGITHCG